jgi:hypothetical protein
LEFAPPFTNGQNASLVLGFPDFTTTANANPQSSLSSICGIGFDPAGNLYVDAASRLMVFAPPFSNGMNASKVIGQPDFNSTGANTTASGLSSPDGIFVSN